MAPYLVGKKAKIAEILIRFQEDTQRIYSPRLSEKRTRGLWKELPVEEIERREKIWKEVSSINRTSKFYKRKEVKAKCLLPKEN